MSSALCVTRIAWHANRSSLPPKSPRPVFYHVQGNFVLIYELLDEVLDHGYPQVGGTAEVLQLIASQPECLAESPCRAKLIGPALCCAHQLEARASFQRTACPAGMVTTLPCCAALQITDPTVMKSFIFQKASCLAAACRAAAMPDPMPHFALPPGAPALVTGHHISPCCFQSSHLT